MRQLAVIITLLLLLPVMALASDMLFTQEWGILIPTTVTATDPIDVPYTGRGWHTVHKRSLKKRFPGQTQSRKTDICPKCHIRDEYRIFDPHAQLNEKGNIVEEKCLYCHLERPDEKHATFGLHRTEIKFIANLEGLCLRCHSRKYHLAHPVNANHILEPSDKMFAMMKTVEKRLGVSLPLNYDGKIMCATCHNPHERGVIPTEKVGAKGASEKFRVRLPGKAESSGAKGGYDKVEVRLPGQGDLICLACHRDKDVAER